MKIWNLIKSIVGWSSDEPLPLRAGQPPSKKPASETIQIYGYEVNIDNWRMFVHMCHGDDERAFSLSQYEYRKSVERGAFYSNETDPVLAAMQRLRDDVDRR